MKKNCKILLLFSIFFCFSSFVYAQDINVKYEEQENIKTYSEIIKNGKAVIKIYNNKFEFDYVNSGEDGKRIVMIPVEDNVLYWIENYSKLSNIQVYYIMYQKNGREVTINNKFNLYTNNTKKMEYIDNLGNILNSSYNNIKITGTGYLVLGSEEKTNVKTEKKVINHNNKEIKTENTETKNEISKYLNLNVGEHGKVFIEGNKYTYFNKLELNKNYKIMVVPDNGYYTEEILINNSESNNSLKNGFIYIDDISSDTIIDIKFKKEKNQTSNRKINFKGKITNDGKPLSNAKIELHSKVMTTYTNSLGEFSFEDIDLGHHTISLYNDNEIIGYTEFTINEDEIFCFEKNDNYNTVKISENTKTIDMNMKLNNFEIILDDVLETSKIEINQNDIELVQDKKDNDNYFIKLFMIVLLIVILCFVLVVYLRKKKK